MRDPDLVVRAQLAASALEGAWQRWRVGHGDVVDPMPAVSSYVGYSLQEPWGQPRVVFGLAAEDAEQLAALLERRDRMEPAYAAAPTQSGLRDVPARAPARDVAVPVPRRTSAAAPRQAPLAVTHKPVWQSPADVLLAGDNSGYDEPLYRQVAAAMQAAAGAREIATRTRVAEAEPARTRPPRDHSEPAQADRAGPGTSVDRPNLADLVSPAWMGSLAMAATTARAEAEARIRAALTKQADEPVDHSEFDDGTGAGSIAADELASDDDADERGTGGVDADVVGVDDLPGADDAQEADADLDSGTDDGRAAAGGDGRLLPPIYATDVLEPLPTSDADAQPAAGIPDAEEPADITEQVDDHEAASGVQPGGRGTGTARRGRSNRGYPIGRLSRTKRPGASTQPAGS